MNAHQLEKDCGYKRKVGYMFSILRLHHHTSKQADVRRRIFTGRYHPHDQKEAEGAYRKAEQ